MNKTPLYRLQRMELEEISWNTFSSPVKSSIDHQSHYPFWVNEDKYLPAFLLYDTDNYREDKQVDCDLGSCDYQQFLTESRRTFMENTVNMIWETILQVQAKKVSGRQVHQKENEL